MKIENNIDGQNRDMASPKKEDEVPDAKAT